MIYVTNGGGHVSRTIVESLAKSGQPVRFLVARAEDAGSAADTRTQIVVGDLLEPETIAPTLEGIDVAILLTRNTPDQVEREVTFAETALASGVTRIVKISAFGADINAEKGAKQTHGHAEEAIRRTGIPWTFVRPQFFMQNILWFAGEIKARGTFTLPMKDGRIGMIDFRDIAAVAVHCATDASHSGRIYNLSGPELLSMRDVADKLSWAIGKAVRYNDVSGEEFRQLLVAMGWPEWHAEGVARSYVGMSEGASEVLTGDVKAILGRGATPFDKVARDYARFFV